MWSLVSFSSVLRRAGVSSEASHPEVSGGAVGGSGVEIAACGGDGRMAEGLLHQMDRRASVEAMTGMGMAQPVRRNLA